MPKDLGAGKMWGSHKFFGLEITIISSTVFICEDLLTLVLVSNQKLGTGGPEESPQAKISQVENMIQTWEHICVQCCRIAIYC
jgi:hypothetical protein